MAQSMLHSSRALQGDDRYTAGHRQNRLVKFDFCKPRGH